MIDHLPLEVMVVVEAAVAVVEAAIVAVLVMPERMMVSEHCYSDCQSVAWAMLSSFSRAIRDALLCFKLDFP